MCVRQLFMLALENSNLESRTSKSASARNVLRWAREVKGVLSFLFSLLEAIHKRWLPSVVTELEHTFSVLPVKGLRRRNSICSPTQRGEFLK